MREKRERERERANWKALVGFFFEVFVLFHFMVFVVFFSLSLSLSLSKIISFISLVVIVAVLKNQKGGVLEKCKCGPRTEAKQKERSKRIKKQKKTQKKNTFPFSLRPIPTHLHHTITFTARQTCRGRRSACPTPRCPGPCTRPPGRRRGGRSRLSGR